MKLMHKLAIVTSVATLSTLSIANTGETTNQQPTLENEEVVQPISENEGINEQYEDRSSSSNNKKPKGKVGAILEIVKEAVEIITGDSENEKDKELDRREKELEEKELEIERIKQEADRIRLEREQLEFETEKMKDRQKRDCEKREECRDGK